MIRNSRRCKQKILYLSKEFNYGGRFSSFYHRTRGNLSTNFNPKDSSDAVINLTGYTAEMDLRKNQDDSNEVITLTTQIVV